MRRVAVGSTGVIGASWVAHFLAHGLDVVATDPAPGAEERLRADLAAHWPVLTQIGLSAGASPDRLAFTTDAAEAVAAADFVQENGPAREDVQPTLFGVLDAKPDYWLVLTIIIIVLIAVGNLERSRVGRSWLAIREDEDAAELMGVPTFRFKLWAFAIGAAIGGLSGALFASKQGFINSNSFLLLTSILFVAAVVLGGSGNLIGVILGAVLVSYLPERFRNFQETRYLVFGLALVVLMIFRPQGLIPNRRRAAEIAEGQEGAMPSVTT